MPELMIATRARAERSGLPSIPRVLAFHPSRAHARTVSGNQRACASVVFHKSNKSHSIKSGNDNSFNR
jgi:hypothetical protein